MNKKIFAALTLALMLSGTYCFAASSDEPKSMQTGDVMLFDFGSISEDGWQTVDASSKYNKNTGYGFSMISFVENAPASGNGVLSDSVRTKKHMNDKVTFNTDLPPGMYEVSVYSGDIKYMSVSFEGHPAILNIDRSTTEARVEIPVTDGQLNVGLCRGISGMDFSLAAMTIKRTGDVDSRKKRIFVCGDSTASSYYPLTVYQPIPDDCRGGWGQMMQTYTDCYVHNFASSGQTAKGFCENGTLDDMLFFMQPEDYVMISFGINDKMSCSEEEFEQSMNTIINSVKQNGGIPIIISAIPTLDDFSDDGIYGGADECYASISEKLAEAEGIKYIDLHSIAAQYFELIGMEQTISLHWNQWNTVTDKIHLNRNGAGQIARLIMEACDEPGLSNTADYGISTDKRLKCRSIDNNMYIENMTPQDMQLALVTAYYTNGDIIRTETTPFTLPAYDVLNPGNVIGLYAPLSLGNNNIYIVGSGICLSLDNNTH
ncbi:MAG: GDSL-type esterase/lipase family protein [Clostridiales bacterium]|nr:GDSL-type esterase/lipase family protein [Clostridiales bacterium]